MTFLQFVSKLFQLSLSLDSLSHCAKSFPSEPESCDNSWIMQPLFENENVKFPKIGKRTSRYKMEIFKPDEYGLYGHNITTISECFQAGRVKQQDSLSITLKNNNFPSPDPDWKLNENQYLLLSNRLKQLTGHGKVRNGLPITFPNTAPLVNIK